MPAGRLAGTVFELRTLNYELSLDRWFVYGMHFCSGMPPRAFSMTPQHLFLCCVSLIACQLNLMKNAITQSLLHLRDSMKLRKKYHKASSAFIGSF
jgi:hypothetical protein